MRATCPAQTLPKLPDGTAKLTRSVVVARRLKVAGEVVHHLRHQSRPVDRVDAADAVLPLESEVAGHRLDDVLAVVEHAFDRDVVDVGVLQAVHLRLLEWAHAPLRRQHEHLDSTLAAHRVLGRATGVARGGAQDVEVITAAREFVFEQCAEQLHRHVLEGQRRPIGQALDPQAGLEPAQRRDRIAAEHAARIGLAAQCAQVCGRHVVDVQRKDLERQVGIRQSRASGSTWSHRPVGSARAGTGRRRGPGPRAGCR